MFDFDFEDLGESEKAVPAEAVVPSGGELQQKSGEREKFVGSWAYLGQKGITVYKVRNTSSGHLLFEGPDSKGKLLSGVLRDRARAGRRQLEAELVGQSGETAGWIRLELLEEECALLSTFRPAGKETWGKGIKANWYIPPAQQAKEVEKGLHWEEGDAFTVHSGFIRKGGDVLVHSMTVAEAKARCLSLPNCKGFCFRGQRGELGENEIVKVYFKDKWDLAREIGGWVAYRYEGASLKLSDMPGEDVDEQVVAEIARSSFSEVYVFKSPLATFPEWRKKLKVHQIVMFWRPEGPAVQLEYFVGGVHFQRKPHPWVHRRGAELVEQLPLLHFEGKAVAAVLQKWVDVGRTVGDTPVAKDCIKFAMEIVETVGAMSKHLLAHFQTTLAMQYDGFDGS